MRKIELTISCLMATLAVDATTSIDYNEAIDAKNPIVIVNGYRVRFVDYAKIKPEHIYSIIELEPADAIEVFGDSGSGGAIVIKLISTIKGFSLDGVKMDVCI